MQLVFLVDSMFRCGLTPVLIETLKIISENVATARGIIQNRLFSEIDGILRSHTGLDTYLASPSSSSASRRPSMAPTRQHSSSLFTKPVELLSLSHLSGSLSKPHHSTSIDDSKNDITDESINLITLALQTLHTFDFYKNHPQGAFQVLTLVRECVINCLDDEVSEN